MLEVKDEMSGIVYTIASSRENIEGDWLFGIAFCNPQTEESCLQITRGLVFIPQKRKDILETIYSTLKYFDKDSLGLYDSF